MESERNTRLISLIALVAAVGGLALGFSVYTRDLLIQPAAEVTLDNLFKVEFSEKENAVAVTNSVTTKETGEENGATGETATINNEGDNPTISGLKANFTDSGQKVTYEFYAVNTGSYDAYLTKIDLDGINKQCTANAANGNGATQDLTTECGKIKLTITVDGEATTDTSKSISTEHKLDKYSGSAYASHLVKVEIEYEESETIPDGDFKVEFGDVKLNYSMTNPAG